MFYQKNHVSIWNWIQKYLPKKLLFSTKRKIDKYIVDETMVKIGSELVWLWVVIETKNKSSFNDHIKRKEYACSQTFSVNSHRRALQTLCFNRDGERSWEYSHQAYHYLKVKLHLHSSFEKSIIIERAIQ